MAPTPRFGAWLAAALTSALQAGRAMPHGLHLLVFVRLPEELLWLHLSGQLVNINVS